MILGLLINHKRFDASVRNKILFATFPVLFFFLVLIVQVGLLYMPFLILVFYFGTLAVIQFIKNSRLRIVSILGIFLFALFLGLYVTPKYYYWLSKEEVRTVSNYNWTGNNGEIVSSSNKKIKILEFWNKGCGACFKKMPMLDELKRELEDDRVQIVCVYIPHKNNEDYKAYYSEFLKDTKYDLTFVYDSLYTLHNTTIGFPQTIILNAENEMIHSDAGFIKETKQVVFNNYKRIILNELNTRR